MTPVCKLLLQSQLGQRLQLPSLAPHLRIAVQNLKVPMPMELFAKSQFRSHGSPYTMDLTLLDYICTFLPMSFYEKCESIFLLRAVTILLFQTPH